MEAGVVINQVIVLFLLMSVGFIARKLGMLNEIVNKKLSEILLNITAPAIAISAFAVEFSKEKLILAAGVFVFSLTVTVTAIFLGDFIFTGFPESLRKILRYVIVYPNCAYMGYPILGGLFGKDGVFYASIYVMVFNIFVWTHGISVFKGKSEKKSMYKAVLNPGIVSVAIGITIFIFSIKLPAPLFKAIDSIGSMTTPLSMLIIGALLADASFKSLFKGWGVYYGSALRLIIIPLLSMVGLGLFGVPEQLAGPCIALVSMPVAVNTAIFAEKFGGDSAFASKCVAFSTLFSIATIPSMVYLLHIVLPHIPVLVRTF